MGSPLPPPQQHATSTYFTLFYRPIEIHEFSVRLAASRLISCSVLQPWSSP